MLVGQTAGCQVQTIPDIRPITNNDVVSYLSAGEHDGEVVLAGDEQETLLVIGELGNTSLKVETLRIPFFI